MKQEFVNYTKVQSHVFQDFNTCMDCCFYESKTALCEQITDCHGSYRTDKTTVYFTLVKEVEYATT